MKSEAAAKEAEKNAPEVVTCSRCERVLTNPKEAVHSRKRVLCVACYENLLDPFHHPCCSGAAI